MTELTAITKPVFMVDVPMIGKISCRTCSVSDYRKLRFLRELRDILERVCVEDIPKTLRTSEIMWAKLYRDAIDDYVKQNMDALMMPQGVKDDDTEEQLFRIYTTEEKLVADYAHLSFIEILDIDIIDYKLIAADAYKHMIMTNKTDAVEYLNGCWLNMHEICSAEKLKQGSEIIISEG